MLDAVCGCLSRFVECVWLSWCITIKLLFICSDQSLDDGGKRDQTGRTEVEKFGIQKVDRLKDVDVDVLTCCTLKPLKSL